MSGDGNTIAVVVLLTSSVSSGEILNRTGSVTIYRWSTDEDTWQPLSEIIGEAAEDITFPSSLNFNGSVLAIGAINNNGLTVGGLNLGHVRDFEHTAPDDGSWIQGGADLESDPLHGNDFGLAVDPITMVQCLLWEIPPERSIASKNVAGSIFCYDRVKQSAEGGIVEGTKGDEVGFSLTLSSDGGSVIALGTPRRVLSSVENMGTLAPSI